MTDCLQMYLGYHRHVGRRGLARDIKEVDGSLSVTEGKSSKRGSTGYSSHEVNYEKIVFLNRTLLSYD